MPGRLHITSCKRAIRVARALRRLAAAACFTLASSTAGSAVANESEKLPQHLVGVGIEERLGETIPRELRFVDERGRHRRLGEAFTGDLPVIITLNYSNCPMLCSLELNGLVDGLKQLPLKLGESYQIVTVSLDPKETPSIAYKTQQRYLKQYGAAGAPENWRFLTGSERQIRALASAIGFKYRYDEDADQYYHAAAVALASPSGKLVRYLYGIEFDPKTLELALVEASRGSIGTPLDRLLLFCSAYDPKEGSYALVASRAMSLAGLLTLCALGVFLLILWRREKTG